jgi:hypothetical protein
METFSKNSKFKFQNSNWVTGFGHNGFASHGLELISLVLDNLGSFDQNINKINLLRNLVFVILALALLHSCTLVPISAAQYILNPSTATFMEGCNTSIDIKIDTQGLDSNAADILVKYDPAKITIIDADTINPGIQIKTGNIYQAYFGNTVDTGLGEIRLTGASFSGSFNGVGTFGIILFKANPGVTSANFDIYTIGYGPEVSLDSNIADTATSNDLLSGVTNGSYNFSTGFCVADTTPPAITFLAPINGQTGVPANATLSIQITDNQAGTDIQTVEVVVNGVTQTSFSSGFSYSGTPLNYSLLITPTNPLITNSSDVVLVRATDFAGNIRTSTITFNTPESPPPPAGDTTSPTISFVNPVDKGTLPLSSDLFFDVGDIGDGIDINSVYVILNGQTYLISSPQLTYSGSPSLYNITFNPDVDLPDSTSYFVVYVADNAGNAVVKSIAFNIKESVVPGPTPTGICPVTPENAGELITQGVNQIVTQTGQPYVVALNPLFGQSDQEVLQTVSAASPWLSFLGSILFLGAQLWQLPYLLFQWLLGLFTFLGLRTRGRPYGYVYDSVSKEPLSLAIVRFFDTTGKLVHTDVTDVYGVFTAKLHQGTYFMTVARPDYKFPSTKVTGKVDYPYSGIYHGEKFNQVEDQDILFSIPMDAQKPITVSPKTQSLKGLLAMFLKVLNPLLMGYGIVLAIYLFFKTPSVFNFVILLLYIPTVYFYIQSLKTKVVLYGIVKTMDGMLLKNLEIGLINTEYDKTIAKRVTDENGEYRFVVHPGNYKLSILNQEFVFSQQPKPYNLESGANRNQPLVISQDLQVSRKVI